MHITLQLLNRNDDELGRLRLQTVRLSAAGAETTAPDLSGQMSRLDQRLILALAQEGMAPVLDPLGVRLAVSRALLAPAPDGVTIPLQVRPISDGGTRDTGQDVPQNGPQGMTSPGAALGAAPVGGPAPGGNGWDDLFVLDPDEDADAASRRSASPFGRPGRKAGGGGNGGLDLWGEAGGWDAVPEEGPTDDEGGWE